MDNHDKIFEQFKTASEKAENKDFPAMEKVWSRIDEKLDRTQIKKETKLWKKLAVAASLLLVASVGYQFFKSEPRNTPNQNIVTTIDTTKTIVPGTIVENNAIVQNETKNALIKEDANQILEEQMIAQPVATAVEAVPAAEKITDIEYDKRDDILEEKSTSSFVAKKNPNDILKGRKYEAISVQHNQMEVQTMGSSETVTPKAATKTNPLVVIDGKADNKGFSKLKDDDIESIVELKEPLYIINNVPYSEEELFGKNPTSPYAPLDQQEIEKTIVLQGEEAIARYGDKGKKGVLIITTKNGKPAKTPKKSR